MNLASQRTIKLDGEKVRFSQIAAINWTNFSIRVVSNKVMNGGFGMVLDGSEEIDAISKCLLTWDVLNGVSLVVSYSDDFGAASVESVIVQGC